MMPSNPTSRGFSAALAIALIGGFSGYVSPQASAGMVPHIYEYSNTNVGTPAISGTDATIDEVFAQWDENTKYFTWSALYSATDAADLPTGFTLVVNDGPMPKGHLGELAVVYFEAEELYESDFNSGDINLTTYAYNGGSSASAHRTSDFRDVQSQTPAAPDQIASTLNNDFTSTDFTLSDGEDNGRKTRFVEVKFDATPILDHVPLQPSIDTMDNDAPLTWTGIQFAQMIGIWFHPFNNINPEYDANGFLEFGVAGPTVNEGWQVVRNNYGFFDVDNLQAVKVPEPASAMLLMAGTAALGFRRRR
ncbi:MAG: PEP-CTERM sorting domain-containing protein [Planctomycetota bacterium]